MPTVSPFPDVIDIDDEVPETQPRLWAQPERSLPEDGAGERVRRGAAVQEGPWRHRLRKAAIGLCGGKRGRF